MEDLFGAAQAQAQSQMMNNMQQSQGMMPMQDQYGQGMVQGYNQHMQGYVHYSRGQVLQMLRDYVVMNTGKTIVCEEKLDDLPMGSLRHCCAESKSIITSLSPYTFQLPEAGIQFQFYFCMDCCKLFYPKDFMI